MQGQVTTVRIVTDEYLPSPHRCYRYTYEVMDADSPFFQRVDYVISGVMLNAGHTYEVRFNDDTNNPRIVDMLSEVLDRQ